MVFYTKEIFRRSEPPEADPAGEPGDGERGQRREHLGAAPAPFFNSGPAF
jgi:hypothetical protein